MSGMTREFGLTPDGGAFERTSGVRVYDQAGRKIYGQFKNVLKPFTCSGTYNRGLDGKYHAQPVRKGDRYFCFSRQYGTYGVVFSQGSRVCVECAEKFGFKDQPQARPDITVPVSRDLASIRARVDSERRAEKDPDRGSLWEAVIDAINELEQAVLDVNRYDEAKTGRLNR